MRLALAAAVAVLGLASCAPLDLYYKPGVPVARLEADRTQCEVRALRDAPVANQIRQTPPRWVPPQQVCNAAGNCATRPGYWLDGSIYTVDVNAPLRARVLDQCMIARGYAPVTLPNCPADVARATPARPTTVLPGRLGPDACAIRRGDRWQIVP